MLDIEMFNSPINKSMIHKLWSVDLFLCHIQQSKFWIFNNWLEK